MSIEAGDAFAFNVNAHKHNWNGKICENPIHWSCGAPDAFRENSCDRGIERCYHLNLFSSRGPRFLTPDTSLANLLADNDDLLDDQICFYFGPKFTRNNGRIEIGEQVFYGVYRIRRTYWDSPGPGLKPELIIEPYPDGWALFPRNSVRKPATPPAIDGVSYLKRVHAHSAVDAIEEAVSTGIAARNDPDWSEQFQHRLENFSKNLDNWSKIAKQKIKNRPITTSSRSFSSNSPPQENAFSILKSFNVRKLANIDQIEDASTQSASTPSSESDAPPSEAVALPSSEKEVSRVIVEPAEELGKQWHQISLPESTCVSAIESQYGQRTLSALQISTITKTLLILTGSPGVGKSWLASRLIDDPLRERSIIIAVSSTWRGREDSLGYVSPITGEFEATELTRFLLRAENAWDAGDRRTWLIILEEFNLSQPEHWLSDVLVRLEFDSSLRADRTIYLGGNRISGYDSDRMTSVYLPPNLKLVATLNNDHTVRPLSPRVLDRAALVEISATGRAALLRVGIDLPQEIEDIVEDLNDILEAHGVAFSVRSARSLAKGTKAMGIENAVPILDHVLSQEVLSKVRLLAGDPRDEQLLARLREWVDRGACSQLLLCAEKVSAWEVAIRAGRDVCQA